MKRFVATFSLAEFVVVEIHFRGTDYLSVRRQATCFGEKLGYCLLHVVEG